MFLLQQLPEDLFRHIQTFVSNDDYHYLLNSSKKYFGVLKRNTIYFALNEEKSLKYVGDETFRKRVLEKVANGWRQISLRVKSGFGADLPAHKLSTTEELSDALLSRYRVECLHSSVGKDTRNVRVLQNVKSLAISNCIGLVDVTSLGHLTRLEISRALDLTDISPLKNVPDLTFSHCKSLIDFSKLGGRKQTALTIRSCPGLKDVSSFEGIRSLFLRDCVGVSDVTALRGVYDLRMYHCKQVKDIKGLGGHHRLIIANCSFDLAGYESLVHIPHVTLNYCSISDVSVLSYARSIQLSECPNIKDVSPMKEVKTIKLSACPNIVNLGALNQVDDLSIHNMIIQDVDIVMARNKRLSLLSRVGYYGFSAHIKHLLLRPDRMLADLIHTMQTPFFGSLQSLTIEFAESLTNVNSLGDVPCLRIVCCPRLVDINGLGRNDSVELDKCPLIKDVSSLSTVSVVTIRHCNGVKNLEVLSKVPRLKVIQSLEVQMKRKYTSY